MSILDQALSHVMALEEARRRAVERGTTVLVVRRSVSEYSVDDDKADLDGQTVSWLAGYWDAMADLPRAKSCADIDQYDAGYARGELETGSMAQVVSVVEPLDAIRHQLPYYFRDGAILEAEAAARRAGCPQSVWILADKTFRVAAASLDLGKVFSQSSKIVVASR